MLGFVILKLFISSWKLFPIFLGHIFVILICLLLLLGVFVFSSFFFFFFLTEYDFLAEFPKFCVWLGSPL